MQGKQTAPSSIRRHACALLTILLISSLCTSSAMAQEPSPSPPPPSLPPAIPGAIPNDGDASPAKVLERLKNLEKTIEELRDENKVLKDQYRRISKELENSREKDGEGSEGGSTSYLDPEPAGASPATEERVRTAEGGGGAYRAATQQGVGNRDLGNIRLKTYYNYGRTGFGFATEDEELSLKFRILAQFDDKNFLPSGEHPVTDGVYLNRARVYFDGYITRPIEYQVSLQQSYDTFNLLNCFVNFNYDKRLQFRVGRFKTPYTYEFYKINVWNLYAPERSIYNVNFALNRQLGGMFWGQLFRDRVEYAVGAFDGARNSYQPYKDTPDAIGFLNIKPFEPVSDPAAPLAFLRDLNFGGSGAWGNENNPLTPAVLRTSTNASSAGITSTSAVNSANVPFLAFNNNVTEKGPRALWELHTAYFYKGLTFMGAWDSGYESWAAGNGRPEHVPVNGYFVQAAYIITGETRTGVGVIDPLRRFDLRRGRFGLGAWEPTARFSDVSVGKQVFSGGLADPNLWTNQAYLVDVGVNWYLNKFVKVYFDWEHAIFGNPVSYAPGQFSKTNDLFWLRLQVWF